MLDLSSSDITSAPLHRVLAILSLPLVVQRLVQVVQVVVDIFWVGRLGGEAVAAIGLVYPVTGLLLVFAITVPYIGTQVLVSQRVGAERETGARLAAFNGVALAIGLSVVFGVGSYVAAPWLIDLMTSTQPESVADSIVPMAVDYFRIIALGMVFAGMSDAIEAAFVARGDSRVAFYVSLATVLTNLVADPILIFGVGPIPGFGIEGAAIATVLGYATGLLTGMAFAATGRSGGILSWAAARIDSGEIRELVSIGLPPAAQRGNRRVVDLLLVTVVFAAGGAIGLSAYFIGTRVSSVASVPASGLRSATQSVVGQNLGANEPERAHRTPRIGVFYIVVLLTVIGAFQWTFAETFATVITPDATEATVSAAVEFLRILAYSYPALGVISVLQGGFNGARRSRVSFFSSVFQYWVVKLPLAIAGGVLLGSSLTTVFWAVAAANVVTALGLGVYYLSVSRSGMFDAAAEEIDHATAD